MKCNKIQLINFIVGFAGLSILAGCSYVPPVPWGQKQPATAPVVVPPMQTEVKGTPLYCMVGKGSALFGRAWYDFSDTSFVLGKRQRVNISVAPKRKLNLAMNFQGYFDVDGQRMIFCPVIDAQPGERITCTSIYALDDDLTVGIKRTFDIPKAVMNGSITCSYKPENLKKF